jgi:hypothetical protein
VDEAYKKWEEQKEEKIKLANPYMDQEEEDEKDEETPDSKGKAN